MVTEEYECSMTLALISFLLEAVEVLVTHFPSACHSE